MDDAADLVEGLVERKVSRRVGGGPSTSVHDFALEVHHDDLLGGQPVVRDATRFDRDQAARAVDSAGIAPGERYQAVRRESEIGGEDLLAQFRERICGGGHCYSSRYSSSASSASRRQRPT